jgi:enamine deaminase RidA (YjgF/YER057c/UK114 family)
MIDQQWNDFCTTTGAGWHDARMRAAVEALMDGEAERLQAQTDYSIKLQQLLESLKREDTPHPKLHHHKMVLNAKAEVAALKAENERIAALTEQNQQLRDVLECCEVVLRSIGHGDLACCISARAALADTPQTWQTELRERTQDIYRKAADHAAGEIIERIERGCTKCGGKHAEYNCGDDLM